MFMFEAAEADVLVEDDAAAAHTAAHAAVERTRRAWRAAQRAGFAAMRPGARTGDADAAARKALADAGFDGGYGHLPVCIAKTPYSFSTDPALKGAPDGHVMDIREVRLSVGAGFVVAICGDVMTMPGLPKAPASEKIDVVDGQIVGLF